MSTELDLLTEEQLSKLIIKTLKVPDGLPRVTATSWEVDSRWGSPTITARGACPACGENSIHGYTVREGDLLGEPVGGTGYACWRAPSDLTRVTALLASCSCGGDGLFKLTKPATAPGQSPSAVNEMIAKMGGPKQLPELVAQVEGEVLSADPVSVAFPEDTTVSVNHVPVKKAQAPESTTQAAEVPLDSSGEDLPQV